jgi:two-component sensor histidine kinase
MKSTADGESHCIICEVAAAVRDHTIGLEQRGASVELLVGELQHRIRNLLTVVQCFVSQTEAATADGFRAALTARIVALSDVHNQIEQAPNHHISLTELLERTLKPYASARHNQIYAAGPDIKLDSRLALALHMIFHELATNASKHGALASAAGRVEVQWDFKPKGTEWTLAIQWSERGGPSVGDPGPTGFGLRLITKVLPDAQVTIEFDRSGLICRMLIKADRSQIDSATAGNGSHSAE